MSPFDVIRCAIPDASYELCEHILWGRTSFPFTIITPRTLFKAAHRLKRAGANSRMLCDFCDNQTYGTSTCWSCTRALDRAANVA